MGFGAWCFAQPEESGSLLLAFAIMSVLLGLFTAVYGVWFYRNKIKQSEEGTPAPAQ